MENKYSDEEWVEIRNTFNLPSIIQTVVDYRKMYAIPNEHQRLLKESLIKNILKEGQQESVCGSIIKNIYDVIFGELQGIPIHINYYHSIVGWRLEHGK